MESQKYWFSILSHVYYVKKESKALLYNTKTGEFVHTQNEYIIELIEQMHEKKNLGVICIDEKTKKQNDINVFINECVLKNICLITEKNSEQSKPVQLMPVLIFPGDIGKNNSLQGEDILKYLSDITIYLNSEFNVNCSDCEKNNNQFFHCTKPPENKNIDFIFLKKFFNQLPPTLIRRITITGENIFLYPYFWELIDFFKKESTLPLLGIHYENIDADKITLLSDFPIDLFVYFPLKEFFEKNIKYLSKNKKIKFIFIISSEECYKNSEYLISKHKIKNYVFNPFFTGKNLNFFKENVFLTTDDILSKPISQKIIFARQKLNTNFFGRIYLFPNGDVKSHPLQSVLGNCKNETLGKIIEKELVNNTSWRIIRDKTPCIDCIYQFLCPSPSEFEWAMNKNNLCKIFK